MRPAFVDALARGRVPAANMLSFQHHHHSCSARMHTVSATEHRRLHDFFCWLDQRENSDSAGFHGFMSVLCGFFLQAGFIDYSKSTHHAGEQLPTPRLDIVRRSIFAIPIATIEARAISRCALPTLPTCNLHRGSRKHTAASASRARPWDGRESLRRPTI
ncbi:hypothetical protein M409DRAFT_49059 [Zasmidium cellare ATCC 36951]|uniref:Uncharacterized protein n=1 Tax=Zasmidium cellare ATCC 36951 TaxID=1080233 RepID=A0A6A6D474_ZASCE|nr:uncharacterized protein M409DRAFT_49059 [Zasmidium cellare ATCC 36951]KAF2174197.1 hypothetical protein M409DRAFT_49059 [Zasmidium cellare ATCC 36951]